MQPLERRFCDQWPPAEWRDITVLLGVSGGPDSVALLRTMTAVRAAGEGQLAVGHFHHGLRGRAADRDAEFVASLCERLAVPCQVGRGDGPGVDRQGSLEAAARKARYRFLRQTAETLGARYIVTAHTADDQAETILHHILRGTGLRGLGGMRRSRAVSPVLSIMRPFLASSRREIVEYLDAIEQTWCDDSSNRDTHFTRNRIRHDLMPQLARDYNPSVVDALLRLGRTAREAQEALLPWLDQMSQQCVRLTPDSRMLIDCRDLAGQPRHLVREMLVMLWGRQKWPQQAMSFAKWDELAGMALAEMPAGRTDQRMFPGAVTVLRTGDHLELTAAMSPRPE